MADERQQSALALGGDLLAWQLVCLGRAVWSPKDLPKNLNPFRPAEEMSEAMRAHLTEWERLRWRAAIDSAAKG